MQCLRARVARLRSPTGRPTHRSARTCSSAAPANLASSPPTRTCRRSACAPLPARTRRRSTIPASVSGQRRAACRHRAHCVGCGGVAGTYARATWLEINCVAEPGYADANWALTAAGTTAAGTCVAGFVAGAPLRTCQIDGTWSSTITNPCQRTPARAATCPFASQHGLTAGLRP